MQKCEKYRKGCIVNKAEKEKYRKVKHMKERKI